MKTIELNETPIRTSKNFNINNISIQDLVIPEVSNEFENVSIEKSNSTIEDICSNINLTYGIGKKLEENVNNYSNSNIKIKTGNRDVIKIEYVFDDDNLNLINNIEIESEGNSDIYIQYKSETEKECFHNGVIRVRANPNSKVNLTIINLLNNNSINIEAIENTLSKSSTVNYTIIDLGAKTSISNYYSNIVGDNAVNDLKTIYLGTRR